MWIIKLAGSVLLTAATMGVSLNAVARMKRRVDALEWYAKAANQIGVQINGTASELYDIVNTLYGSRDYLELSRPFSVIFKPCGITADEKRIAEEFFEGLGMGEITAQVKRCEAYSDMLHERYRQARAEYLEKSKLYKMLGLFVGLAVSIILV